MAVLFSVKQDGKLVEVRSAGATRRLYVDGVLHTQYNPRYPLTGDVWDAITFGGLMAPMGAIERVLVLGLGGGAVIHLLRQHLAPKQIVAVELDPLKIQLAERFFGLAPRNDLTIVEGDARLWLQAYRDAPFDLVIDDLFGESDGQPQRAVALDAPWYRALVGLLARPGCLTVNFGETKDLHHSVLCEPDVRRAFPSACKLTVPFSYNCIVAMGQYATDARALAKRVRSLPGLQAAQHRRLLRLRASTLWSAPHAG